MPVWLCGGGQCHRLPRKWAALPCRWCCGWREKPSETGPPAKILVHVGHSKDHKFKEYREPLQEG